MAKFRQTYWSTSLRAACKRVLRDCRSCRRFRIKPEIPQMGELPLVRLEGFVDVFSRSGVDLWGPMSVKERRSIVKRWGALFICMASKSVHLEIISNLETDGFIMALRRFMARRCPQLKELWLDCGSNFKGAVPELKPGIENLRNDPKFLAFMSAKEIDFHFSPPKGPNFGGLWERNIGEIKRSLKIVLKDRVVREDTLHYTTLTEIECVINSRPLTYLGDDPNDLNPLTPNHLLMHSNVEMSQPDIFTDADLNSRKQWRQSQILVQHFWKRYLKEVLPNMTVAAKWNTPEKHKLAVGDVVLIVDHSAPRGHWPLRRVQECHQGRDDRVMVVTLKTKNGTFVRPTSQVCLLETHGNDDNKS